MRPSAIGSREPSRWTRARDPPCTSTQAVRRTVRPFSLAHMVQRGSKMRPSAINSREPSRGARARGPPSPGAASLPQEICNSMPFRKEDHIMTRHRRSATPAEINRPADVDHSFTTPAFPQVREARSYRASFPS